MTQLLSSSSPVALPSRSASASRVAVILARPLLRWIYTGLTRSRPSRPEGPSKRSQCSPGGSSSRPSLGPPWWRPSSQPLRYRGGRPGMSRGRPPLPPPGRHPSPARERRGLAELHAGRGQRCWTTAEPQGPVAASGPPAGRSRPTAVLVPRTRRRPRAALESEPADGGALPPRKHCQQCASSRSRLSCFAPSPLHPQGNCSLVRVCASLVVCCAFQPVLMTAASKPQSQLLLLLTAR